MLQASYVTGSSPRKHYDLATAAHDYAPWHGPPRRTVLVCSHPRSGSTLLGEALYFAGNLGCPLEYFHAGFRPAFAERWHSRDIDGYAAAVTRHRTDPTGTLAVKLFWRDIVDLAVEIDPVRFKDIIHQPPDRTSPDEYRAIATLLAPWFPAPSYIYLSRRDRIRQAISAVAASDTGRWRHIPDIDERQPAAPPVFELDRIEGLIAHSDFCHDHWRNFFAALDVSPHVMTYEGLAADYLGCVTGALRFLGSDAEAPPIRMQRQADEISEAVVLQFLRARATAAAARS